MEQRATYDTGTDALERAEQQYLDLLRRHHGPNVHVEVLTRRVLAPEADSRPALSVVGDWLTLREAGAELGRSWSTIKRLGQEGRLRLVQREGQWHVHRTEVDRLKAERR